jgi:anti-anti-sigma regulatory factor
MHFKLAEEASVLTTRRRGAAITCKVELALSNPANKVVLDFEGVSHISHSFASEFLGAVIGHARYTGSSVPALINVSPEIRTTLYDSLSRRQLDAIEVLEDVAA